MPIKTLKTAKINKNDEYYTRLEDIEIELKHYKKHFENKVVYCNCDDPYESNFVQYFIMHFNDLKIKKLIATSYLNSIIANKEISLFNNNVHGYVFEINEMKDYNGDGATNILDFKYYLEYINKPKELVGTGDFRSSECLKYLEEADIVVTNPPFSLFRDYVKLLMDFKKKFLIIGNPNAITYKEIFPLIKNNELWLGYKPLGTDTYFYVSNSYAKTLVATKKEGSGYVIRNGRILGRAMACWYTNLTHKKRKEQIDLFKKYNINENPKYDNFDCIEVNEVKNIPEDYNGYMGVPITFLGRYCPDQFEIIGLLNSSTSALAGIPILRSYNNFIELNKDGNPTGGKGSKANGNPILKGIPKNKNYYYNPATNEFVYSTYARIVIKKK